MLWLLRADIVIGVLLAAAACLLAWFLTGISEHIPTLCEAKADDVWFEGDVKRVFDNMTLRYSPNYRTSVHPLFSLLALAPTNLCIKLLGMTRLTAVRLTIACAAAFWITLFFGMLRTLGCRREDAVLFSLVAATSSAAIFWTAVPETYLFGSVTIIVVLMAAAFSERRPIPAWIEVGVAAGALSILVTNWMFALASLLTRHKIKETLQLASNALVVVVLLWAVQKYVVPSAAFFLGARESIGMPDTATVPAVFFLHSMVMPHTLTIPNDHAWLWLKFSVQHAMIWNHSSWGTVALIAWIVLLAAGVWAATTLERLQRFRLLLAMALAGQLALHLIYGNETFLYVLDWVPLLVTTAALATFTQLRWVVRLLAVVFIVCAAQNNYAELRHTLDLLAVAAS